MNKFLIALLATMISQLSFAATSDSSPSAPVVWDLRPLYPSTDAWDAERQALAPQIEQLIMLKGTLGNSPSAMADALDQMNGVRRRLNRLLTYSSLDADVDTRDATRQERKQLAESLNSKFDQATSFFDAEVIALGADKVNAFIEQEPRLKKNRLRLISILRLAPHTLSDAEEALLSSVDDSLSQPQTAYSQLTNAELPWPTVSIRGKAYVLDQQTYVALRTDDDPAVRKQVFEAFWPVYKSYQRTIGALYLANLKGTVFKSKARHYPNAVSAALASDNTPEGVYRTLIEEAHAGLPTLQRYLRIRSKILGLSQAGYQDIYVPLAKPPRTYTVGEAEQLTLEALKPLGSAYTDKLAANFQASWMHAVPGPGKRNGAYMNDAAYDVHPYVLLSFNDDYNSVSALAHEWGHAMHSVYADAAQPFEASRYRIFVAEIPSTTNELLLADHVAATAKTREEKIFALSQELELMRATFFRQAMFAEFELKSHEAVEEGRPLTGQKLSAIYLDLLRQYQGDKEGVMKIDDLYGVEWAYIPHFYNDFYVFQYATCVAAAAYFADGIEKGDMATRDRYFAMLSTGGSDDAYATVKRAGPDLATPEPYRALVARMNRAMDQLEALEAEK